MTCDLKLRDPAAKLIDERYSPLYSKDELVRMCKTMKGKTGTHVYISLEDQEGGPAYRTSPCGKDIVNCKNESLSQFLAQCMIPASILSKRVVSERTPSRVVVGKTNIDDLEHTWIAAEKASKEAQEFEFKDSKSKHRFEFTSEVQKHSIYLGPASNRMLLEYTCRFTWPQRRNQLKPQWCIDHPPKVMVSYNRRALHLNEPIISPGSLEAIINRFMVGRMSTPSLTHH
jgi:hypothetical protein